MEQIQLIQNVFIEYTWHSLWIGAALVIATRLLANLKSVWIGVGCILLILAIGNIGILISANLNPANQLPCIISSLLFGGLGLRILGNWLLEDAK